MDNKTQAKIKINEILELVKKVKKTGCCGEKTLDHLEADLCKLFNLGLIEGYNEAKEDF